MLSPARAGDLVSLSGHGNLPQVRCLVLPPVRRGLRAFSLPALMRSVVAAHFTIAANGWADEICLSRVLLAARSGCSLPRLIDTQQRLMIMRRIALAILKLPTCAKFNSGQKPRWRKGRCGRADTCKATEFKSENAVE